MSWGGKTQCDGSGERTLVVSYLESENWAKAAFLARRARLSGHGLLVDRENWKVIKGPEEVVDRIRDVYAR